EQALEQAATVVVLWSHHSIGSHWVRDEAALARDRSRLVPVSLDGVDPPLGFRQFLCIDLSRWRGRHDAAEFLALLSALQQAGAAAGTPPPAPATLPRGRISRRSLLLAGGAVGIAAAGGLGWWAWRRGPAEAVEGNGVAVLPFENLSGDPAQAYFSDGLAAEVRGALARNHGLRVIAQVSSDAFRNANMNAVAIAGALGVAHLLDGSVRRSGGTFRIAAELIDGHSGFSGWSATFDRPIDNIFAVQSEIAASVVTALSSELNQPQGGGKLAPAPEALSFGTTSVPAFDAYLRGRALYNQAEDEAGERAALAQFDAAITADPRFAAAHAARARELLVIANQYASAADTPALYNAAVAAAQTAAALAPDLADAQSTLGFVLFQGRLDVRGAREPYELSRTHGEGDATVMGRYALYCAYTGRAAQAVPAMRQAVGLDPLNALVHRAMGEVLYALHRYREALEPYDRALTLNPKLPGARAAQGDVLLMLGRTREARDAYLAEAHKLMQLPGLAIVEHRLGHEAAAHEAMNRLLGELGDSALYQQAQVRAQWGERQAAMDVLARARAAGDSGLIYANTDPMLDPLRSLPAFRELLSQLGFV
ncbi:MAG TPA: TIR domain-containing protein, partial [Steroidobacteraceae bacterium]|nr:TIR domain-containing protein [Steroidobacteraceae bacterium]